MRPIRLGLTIVAVIILVGVAWASWQTWHVSKSLSAAADDARSLQTALGDGDQARVDESLKNLKQHAGDADDRTSGITWSLMTHLPVYGDDAQGVQLVSSVLDDLTGEGFTQLADSASDLDAYLPKDGKIPLGSLQELQGPVTQADAAFAKADRRLASEDPSSYVGPLRTNYQALAERVSDASSALATAQKALGLLPGMLGGDGPRDYLLIFQNNAEIRASGGLPGAWALVHVDDGVLAIRKQGTAGDFPPRDGKPVLPISSAEAELYGPQLGEYFQDANFTPDFTRSAELWHVWWDSTFPGTAISGVLSFDPVAMSYLLASTGPVQVADVSLTQENAVEELLSKPYLTGDNASQDVFFAQAAQAIFSAVTNNLQSPMEFLRGLQRGAREGRLHLTSFSDVEQDQISGTQLEGAVTADDGSTPHVQIALNDATGSKMSYYLRYRADVDARSCSHGKQILLGSMSLNQSIPAAEAEALPPAVTGGGLYGTQPGRQLVITRIYGPSGGSIDDLRIDGQEIEAGAIHIDGRPVALVVTELSGPDDVLLTWRMRTGPDQDGDGTLGLTPSVVPGGKNKAFASAC